MSAGLQPAGAGQLHPPLLTEPHRAGHATRKSWSRHPTGGQPSYDPTAQHAQQRDPRNDDREEAAVHGWVSVRNAAITRMHRAGSRHVSLAVDPPRGRGPGPPALAFLYAWEAAGSTAQRAYYKIGAATGLFDDSEDTAPGRNVRDLPLLLQGL